MDPTEVRKENAHSGEGSEVTFDLKHKGDFTSIGVVSATNWTVEKCFI